MAIKFSTSESNPRRRKRLSIRIIPAKFEGGVVSDGQSKGMTIRVETRVGIQNKKVLLSPTKEIRGASSQRVVGKGGVEWGENDGVYVKSCSDQSELDLMFIVLRKVEGRDQKREKWEEMGRVGMRVAELWKKMEVDDKLPIQLRGGGKSMYMLKVVVRIEAEEGVHEELGPGGESSKTGLMSCLSFPAQKRNKVVGGSPSPDLRELTRSNSLPGFEMETRPPRKKNGVIKKMGSWFSRRKRKVGVVEKKIDNKDELLDVNMNGDGLNENVMWQVRETVSRDGETKLMCSVGLATYDQCSAEVAGEGACSVIAAVVAHWLHANKGRMPNRVEFDRLLMDGSAEWKKLNQDGDIYGRFPNKHYDLDTVVRAGIRPLKIKQESSVVGFFSPEKFELLKGFVCVDAIWKDIEKRPGVYIVSWNDHFCVLKVEEDACYVIDSLGKTLTEEGNEAFILKFDQSSVIKHTNQVSTEKETESKEAEASGSLESAAQSNDQVTVEVEDETIICKGKECCKEYFKRFLAGLLVTQLELNAEKDIMGSTDLYKRLQIDFHYTCSKK